MSDSYQVTQTKLANLTRYQTAAYNEICVINKTNENLILLDNQNNASVLPSSNTQGVIEDCVIVFSRNGVGPTLSQNGSQMNLDGIMIKIERYRLRNNPIYIKEIDRVLCTEEQSATVKHPFAKAVYSETLEEAIDRLANTIDSAPGIRLIANDPTNTFDKLYTTLGDGVISIPVTHSDDDKVKLTIISVKDGKFYDEDIDISSLTTGTENMIKINGKIVPWVTTSEINAIETARSFQWISPDYLTEIKNKLMQENKKSIDTINSQNSAKVNELTIRNTTLEAELTRLESERDDYKFKYNNVRADRQTNLDTMNNYYAMLKAQNDYGVANGNLQLSGYKVQAAQQESQFKLWHLALAAGLPILGLMAMKIFEGTFKK